MKGVGARLSIVVVALALIVAGCASAPRSTRITQSDLDATVAAMVDSLAGSAFLRDRGPGSPPIVIVTNRVENLTDDVIPIAEQWMLVARLQSALPVTELAEARSVRFVIPPERYAMLQSRGYDGDGGDALKPTHLLTATFMSARRAGRDEKRELTTSRANYYYLEYSVTELDGRTVAWSDAFEFKREAFGTLID